VLIYWGSKLFEAIKPKQGKQEFGGPVRTAQIKTETVDFQRFF